MMWAKRLVGSGFERFLHTYSDEGCLHQRDRSCTQNKQCDSGLHISRHDEMSCPCSMCSRFARCVLLSCSEAVRQSQHRTVIRDVSGDTDAISVWVMKGWLACMLARDTRLCMGLTQRASCAQHCLTAELHSLRPSYLFDTLFVP